MSFVMTSKLIDGMEEAIFGGDDEYDKVRRIFAPRREGKTTAIAIVLSVCEGSYYPITVYFCGEVSAKRFKECLEVLDCKIDVTIDTQTSLLSRETREQLNTTGIHISDDSDYLITNEEIRDFMKRCDQSILITTDNNMPCLAAHAVIYLETWNQTRSEASRWKRRWTVPSYAALHPFRPPQDSVVDKETNV